LLAVTQAGRGEINPHQTISQSKQNVYLSDISCKGRATHYLGCIDALSEAGQFVPRDVSVVGANDIPMLSRMVPVLTTMNTPMYKMGC
jgi:hypothetical protein